MAERPLTVCEVCGVPTPKYRIMAGIPAACVMCGLPEGPTEDWQKDAARACLTRLKAMMEPKRG